jgi:hypothetical protein
MEAAMNEPLRAEVWKLRQHLDQLRDATDYTSPEHTKAALYKTADIRDSLTEIATMLVEQGVNDGLTQATMARCMDVPASTLRGAIREFAR